MNCRAGWSGTGPEQRAGSPGVQPESGPEGPVTNEELFRNIPPERRDYKRGLSAGANSYRQNRALW